MGEAADYLDPRAKMAMARVMLGFAPATALRYAEAAFGAVVDLAFKSENAPALSEMPVPWPIRNEPTLVIAYCESLELARRQSDEDARYAAAASEHAAECQRREDERAEGKRRFEAGTPTADAFMSMLERGQKIELCLHSLSWDAELGTLSGDNAYGVEYHLGAMTLRNLQSWRTSLLAGGSFGACPPCDDVEHFSHADEYDALYPAYLRSEQADAEIEDELDQLRSCQAWQFDETLQLITRIGVRSGIHVLRCGPAEWRVDVRQP